MILPSFRRKNAKWKAKAGVSPPPSQCPVSPEEVLDINEKAMESRVTQDSSSTRDTSVDLQSPSTSSSRIRLNAGSPLQLDYIPEPLEDWFPKELLNGTHEMKNFEGTYSVPELEIANATPSDARKECNQVVTSQYARNANVFHSRQPSGRLAHGTLKKSIPAPIFIPDVEGAPATMQMGQQMAIVAAPAPAPQGSDPEVPPRTSPPSPVSDEDMSAISGTTIARALIGNSFVLSSSDRYRGVITRQDSATLPRGDNPLFNSLPLHNRRISGAGNVDPTHEFMSSLPPSIGARLPDQADISTANDKNQAPSDTSASSTEYSPTQIQYVSPDMIMHSGLSRHISRISEVPSPAPTTPMFPQSICDDKPINSGSSVAASLLTRTDDTGSDFPTTASCTPETASSSQSFHQMGKNISTTSVQLPEFPSSSSTDNGLDEYTFLPPQHLYSVTSSGSDSGILVGRLRSKYGDISLKRRRTRVLGLVSSSSLRSFKASGVLSDRTGAFQRNKKQIRLPIGERPDSIISPQTPITPAALMASTNMQRSSVLSQFPLVPSSAVPIGHIELPMSALADVDSLVTTPLSSAGIFAKRQRIFGAPRPCTVVRDYDLLDCAISVTPNTQNSWDFTSSSSSSAEQTFPETPNIFTPLFTPDYPVSSFGLLLPHGHHDVPRAPLTSGVFNDECQLPQMKTLDIQSEENLTNNDISPGFRRPISVDSHMISIHALQHVPPEATTNIAPFPLSLTMGRESNAATASPLSPVDPLVSSLYHLSTSSDELQDEEALRSLATHFASSISPNITPNECVPMPSKSLPLVEQPRSSASVPLPESKNESPHPPASIPPMDTLSNPPGLNFQPSSPNLQPSSPEKRQIRPNTQSPDLAVQLISPQPQTASSVLNNLLQRPESSAHAAGTSFLPSVSPPPPSTPPRSPHPPSLAASSTFTPSFIAPPPYHTVISGRNDIFLAASTSDSPMGSNDVSRQASVSATHGLPNIRNRTRLRPPLPIGPRKPSGPQSLGSFVPGIRNRNGLVSSVGSGYGIDYSWCQLSTAASSPPPKFQAPPQKWRGMTLEAAQWTLEQHELQALVSRAIKQSAEASSIRLLKLETLDVDIPEEVHRLEMQRTDVKSRYKMLVRKRWQLMGSLAGHLDLNDTITAARMVEELSEVSLALDQLADELHNISEQLGQLKSLNDVHSASALAVALRKINTIFLNQVAETKKLREQMEAMEAERDEGWKQAELVAQDFDNLTDQVQESPSGQSDGRSVSKPLSRRSTQVSAVRKSSMRQSRAGLRSVSRCRSRRSSVSSSGTRTSLIMPVSFTMDDIPPVPPLPLHRPLGIVTSNLSRRNSLVSGTSLSDSRALQEAQKELYEMLGLTLQETPSDTSPLACTASGMFGSKRMTLGPRPMSDIIMARPHTRQNKAIHSVLCDDVRLSTTA